MYDDESIPVPIHTWARRRVLLCVIDRANWGRLQPLAAALRSDDRIELSILCAGSTTLKRFGGLAEQIEAEGYAVTSRTLNEIDGSTPLSMARSGGLCQMDVAAELERLKPDCIVLIGDRYQALAVATASVTLGIPLVHLQGGEVSGSLDERYRHAISKLADFHVPATQRAADYLVRMGERPETILAVGCPGCDIVPVPHKSSKPYLMIVHHPDTTRIDRAKEEMQCVLLGTCMASRGHRAAVWWPNIDAGSDAISKVIRQSVTDVEADARIETIKNLSPEEYAGRLQGAACCIGNSSSFIRDSARFGTPVVLVGARQDGRERGDNVLRVDADAQEIATAIRHQLAVGRYGMSDLYGKPGVSREIVEALVQLVPYKQKRLGYTA